RVSRSRAGGSGPRPSWSQGTPGSRARRVGSRRRVRLCEIPRFLLPRSVGNMCPATGVPQPRREGARGLGGMESLRGVRGRATLRGEQDPQAEERDMSTGWVGRRVAIVEGCRTPFARAGTAFKDMTAIDLGTIAV